MASDWHLVLARDGTVLGATDGAPPSWIGTRLVDRDDVPQDLKEAGRALLANARWSAVPVAASPFLQSMQRALHLTVIDALPLRREPTDLRALLRSTLEALQRQAAAADVTLNVAVDEQLPSRVSLDADKIAWAIAVLVGNALRYVHRGSQLMPGGSIAVRVIYDPALSQITLEVHDDGPGIPTDKLRFLFSVGPDQPRVGLGLSMVREVMAAHAGDIAVDSDTDALRHGTTIRLRLPVW